MLNLEYDKKEKTFVGLGYKSLEYEKLSEYRDGKWHKATGSYNYKHNPTPKVDYDRKEYASTSSINFDQNWDSARSYWPGFHIFLNKKDAVEYHNSYYSNFARINYGPKAGKRLILVQFKFITAFGTNSTRSDKDGPCVIAQQMKYIETIKFAEARRLSYAL